MNLLAQMPVQSPPRGGCVQRPETYLTATRNGVVQKRASGRPLGRSTVLGSVLALATIVQLHFGQPNMNAKVVSAARLSSMQRGGSPSSWMLEGCFQICTIAVIKLKMNEIKRVNVTSLGVRDDRKGNVGLFLSKHRQQKCQT